MKRINVMVSDEAKVVLVAWKTTQDCQTLDEAMDNLLIQFVGLVQEHHTKDTKAEVAERKEAINHIDDLMKED